MKKVYFITHGCKANQYDTETFRQELQARGAVVVDSPEEADACVINTCTVTNQADVGARKAIRKAKRANPNLEIVVAGCSSSIQPEMFEAMPEVTSVVRGHDAQAVAGMIAPVSPLLGLHEEAIGGDLLQRNDRGTRAWMKVQDGCDRKCAFCATKVARGVSRSRDPQELIREARLLASNHPEIVITGVHIGHYGYDLGAASDKSQRLSTLMAKLLDEVPDVRFRLGSVEATEIDDLMIHLLETSGGRLVPHLHVPMQSGSDAVLRRMRRWHNREQYRVRMLEIASRLPVFGFGADIIVGFPGEEEAHHEETRRLVEELPFTYLHVFPYSIRDGTPAATFDGQVPRDIKSRRSKELRDLAQEKGQRYRAQRVGSIAQVVIEDQDYGITEDYLRVRLEGPMSKRLVDLVDVPLSMDDTGQLVAQT